MPHASWSMVHLLVCGQVFMSCMWHLLIPLGVPAWKWTYIMVIGNCQSRTFHMWQYLIRSQVLYGCTLNTDFLFDNRCWHAVDLRYKRNLLSCIRSTLDALKVMLSCIWKMSCTWQEFCRPVWWLYWHIMTFLTQFNVFSLYLQTI